jgi:hypothetical protein
VEANADAKHALGSAGVRARSRVRSALTEYRIREWLDDYEKRCLEGTWSGEFVLRNNRL